MARIAIAAKHTYTPAGAAGPWFDDRLLAETLAEAGHEAAIVSSTWHSCADPA